MKKKISKSQIIKNLFKNIDYFNLSLNEKKKKKKKKNFYFLLKKKIKKKENFYILGKKSKLDSLDLATFFTQLEDSFYKEFKIKIIFLDIFFSFEKKNELSNLKSLVKIIEKYL